MKSRQIYWLREERCRRLKRFAILDQVWLQIGMEGFLTRELPFQMRDSY